MEPLAWALPRRTRLDVPRARRVHGRDRDLGLRERADDAWEGLADVPTEGEAEDGVDDVVGVGEGGVEVVGEGDVEGFELGAEALVEVAGGLLGVVDCGLVGVVEEVAGGNEAVAAVVAAGGLVSKASEAV